MTNRLHTIIGVILGLGALAFVLLLAGVGSAALTDDPPAVSPYASSNDDGQSDVEDEASSYPPGSGSDDTTTTVAAAPATSASLTISGFDFGDPISVEVGTEVTITNEDGASHTWTSADGVWNSGNLSGGDSFSFTFTEAGTFEFFCGIHSTMTGSITVTG